MLKSAAALLINELGVPCRSSAWEGTAATWIVGPQHEIHTQHTVSKQCMFTASLWLTFSVTGLMYWPLHQGILNNSTQAPSKVGTSRAHETMSGHMSQQWSHHSQLSSHHKIWTHDSNIVVSHPLAVTHIHTQLLKQTYFKAHTKC